MRIAPADWRIISVVKAPASARRLIRRGTKMAGSGSVDRTGRIRGRARLGKRTKHLVRRIAAGDVAVIDHPDVDRIAAEDLVAAGVSAVLNNASSSTGRYPNVGPLLLARAGTPLVDFDGRADLFELLSDGEEIELDGTELLRDGDRIASGTRLSERETEDRLEHQRRLVDAALASFAENTLEHVREESELLSGDIAFPPIRTVFRDRHTLIVVRGPDYRDDLAALSAYIRDVRPLIVAVDGGADAVLDAGFKPDVILGDMDSASGQALRSGAELIVHAYPDGRAPGRERLGGLEHQVVPAAGTSEDVAMLLAHERGARLIVMVGAHFNLTEFLDKDRAGMSSTFLTRLRVGETLVDAKGVSRLYRPGLGLSGAAMFLAAFVVLLVIVVVASPALDNVTELLWLKIRDALGV
jgi:uncharacterized membrane-anchored protein